MIFPVPEQTIRHEVIIKKSRFIGIVARVDALQTMQALLANAKQEFPDARHHCYAYIAGPPDRGPRACSDDGEPQGTAGKPILNVLQHSGVGEIGVIVVRYFGGIKLGAGGLVRAYSGCTAELIKQLPVTTPTDNVQILIEADYAFENDIRHLLTQQQANNLTAQYQAGLLLTASVPRGQLDSVAQQLRELTRGSATLRQLDH